VEKGEAPLKRGFLLAFVAFLLAASAPGAYAWGPNTHVYITERALENARGTYAYDLINKHRDAFMAGLMYPDVMVIYYYTKFEVYKSTHSWSFANKLLAEAGMDERRLAFAYGVMCHLIQDTYAHNYLIPEVIKTSLFPNDVIHPIYEGRVEAKFVSPVTTRAMDSVEEFLPWVNSVLQRDTTSETLTLKRAIGGGGFYDLYTPRGTSILYQFYKLIGGVIPEVGEAENQSIANSVSRTVIFFRTGGYPPLDPHGQSALSDADSRIMVGFWGLWIAVLVVAIVIVLLVIRWRRSRRGTS
jgi:hypothetical protein